MPVKTVMKSKIQLTFEVCEGAFKTRTPPADGASFKEVFDHLQWMFEDLVGKMEILDVTMVNEPAVE